MRTLMEYQNSPVLRLGLLRQVVSDKIYLHGDTSLGANDGLASGVYNFPACDLNNTLLFYNGCIYDPNDYTGAWASQARLSLPNNSQILAARNLGRGPADTYFTLLEFHPGIIRSVQRGVTTIGSAAGNFADLTIAPYHPVDTKRAIVQHMGWVQASGILAVLRVTLQANGTQIRLEGSNVGAAATWQVWEW